MDLNGLAGSQVRIAVAEHRIVVGSLAEHVGHEPYLAGLDRVKTATRDLDPHHERVATLALRVEADPLEPLLLAWDCSDRCGTCRCVGVDDRVRYVERVAVELPAFDLVQLTCLAVRTQKLHRDSEPAGSNVKAALGGSHADEPSGASIFTRPDRSGRRCAAYGQVSP